MGGARRRISFCGCFTLLTLFRDGRIGTSQHRNPPPHTQEKHTPVLILTILIIIIIIRKQLSVSQGQGKLSSPPLVF